MKKIWTVKVTFEYDRRPPQTTEHQVEAQSLATAAFRAVRLAKQETRPREVGSMVVLVLGAQTAPRPVE